MSASIEQNVLSGVGIGLRSKHYQTILQERPSVPWFEALTDNYLGDGGYPLHYLSQVREHYRSHFSPTAQRIRDQIKSKNQELLEIENRQPVFLVMAEGHENAEKQSSPKGRLEFANRARVGSCSS